MEYKKALLTSYDSQLLFIQCLKYDYFLVFLGSVLHNFSLDLLFTLSSSVLILLPGVSPQWGILSQKVVLPRSVLRALRGQTVPSPSVPLPCTQSTHRVLERSNPFPALAAPSKLAAPLFSEFLLALSGFFCSQVHQTTSPVLLSSCSHIDPDSMQVSCLVVCPYLLKF